MSETDRPARPPPFDDPMDAADVEQRIYGVLLGTRQPTAASAIADAADCDPKTARKYLSWFASLGICTAYDGRPRTYERNDAYFEWRRIDELASTHSLADLQERVATLTEDLEAYRDRYGAATPGDVDVLAFDDEKVETVYEDLGDWATIERERRLTERARQQVATAGTDRRE